MTLQPTLFNVPGPPGAPLSIIGSAVLSPCGTYRYRLWRQWSDGPTVAWVLLNPSTADAQVNDPTIRRLLGYSRRFGAGRLEVVNLFALRSTQPGALELHPDPIGPENDRHLLEAAQGAEKVVCAWGTWGLYRGRGAEVAELLRGAGVELWALKRLKDGSPGHPLYCRGDLELERWEGSER